MKITVFLSVADFSSDFVAAKNITKWSAFLYLTDGVVPHTGEYLIAPGIWTEARIERVLYWPTKQKPEEKACTVLVDLGAWRRAGDLETMLRQGGFKEGPPPHEMAHALATAFTEPAKGG